MSRAVKINFYTQTDREYLKFRGASKYLKELERLRFKHESIFEDFFETFTLESEVNLDELTPGFEPSTLLFSEEQLNILHILRRAANEVGYSVEVSKLPADKNSTTRVLLKHDRTFTFDDIFVKPHAETRELVYLKKKDGAR